MLFIGPHRIIITGHPHLKAEFLFKDASDFQRNCKCDVLLLRSADAEYSAAGRLETSVITAVARVHDCKAYYAWARYRCTILGPRHAVDASQFIKQNAQVARVYPGVPVDTMCDGRSERFHQQRLHIRDGHKDRITLPQSGLTQIKRFER